MEIDSEQAEYSNKHGSRRLHCQVQAQCRSTAQETLLALDIGFFVTMGRYSLRRSLIEKPLRKLTNGLGRFRSYSDVGTNRSRMWTSRKIRNRLYEDGELASGLGCNITLVFRDLRWCLNFREELRAKCKLMSRESLDRSFLPTGGIASNNEPKGIWLPSGSPDAPLYDDGAGPVFFSEEIRVALRAGGFPYWEQMFKRRRVSSHLGFCAKLPELRKVLHRDLVDF